MLGLPPGVLPGGSSPLARGLPQLLGLVHDDDGIIPARAGFTPPGLPRPGPPPDHPRSRGVCRSQAGEGGAPAGSSPLARGLPFPAIVWRYGDGIIPARAGFTSSSTSSTSPATGSSPLARGLLLRGGENLVPVRIIPARAGFTSSSTSSTSPATGSSPLARGLLLRGGENLVPVRIIPARAGFTF